MRSTVLFVVLPFVVISGCASDAATGRRCGEDLASCSAGGKSGAPERGGAGGMTQPPMGGSAGSGTWNALTVSVEDIEGMEIEIVTLSCPGECADIEAVVHGGNPPYAFEWEDGSTSAARTVCLDESAVLSVSATDTEIVEDEFGYEAQTARTEVTANVLECPQDSGVVDEPDAGPSELCILNPSFEGMPTIDMSASLGADAWQACEGLPDIRGWELLDPMSPLGAEGTTYLTLEPGEAVSSRLCTRFNAGSSQLLLVDISEAALETGALQIYGSTARACEQEELLVQTGPLSTSGAPGWFTYCLNVAATTDAQFVTFAYDGETGGPRIAIDNMRVADACP